MYVYMYVWVKVVETDSISHQITRMFQLRCYIIQTSP